MILSNASVRRPVAMGCLIIGLSLLGLDAFRNVGLEMMPSLDIPFVTVVTVYPGASPQEIETDVAKRVEDALMTVEGVKHIDSTCLENACINSVEFQLGVDVNVAATDIREAINLIMDEFPPGVEMPSVDKFDLNATPVVTLALAGEAGIEEIYDYADNTLRDRIATLQGVADVQIVGGAEREVHVSIDRRKLAARGLFALDVYNSIRGALGVIPSGRVRENGLEYSVKFDGDFRTPEALLDLEIAKDGNARCYLRDVAQVGMTTDELRQKATLDGKDAIVVKVIKRGDANAVAVVDRVQAALAPLQETLPGGMELVWVRDDGAYIRATNDSAWVNVFQGILLTGAILFLFLYDVRTVFVVAVTMPLTVLIGLFPMQACGFSLNTSTLLAIGMSVGILVTNSIVVIEAIAKHKEMAETLKHAAVSGASEAFIPVLASALTNLVVLLPLATMKTKIGMFFRPFALTMLIMTLVSLFISFTLTPMLCTLVLKKVAREDRGILGWFEHKWNSGVAFVVRIYRWGLVLFERHRWLAALACVGVFMLLVHSLGLAKQLGSDAFSEVDRGEILVKIEFPAYYSLDRTTERTNELLARLEGMPELRTTMTTIGKVEGILGQASEGVYLAQALAVFSKRTEREMTIQDLIAIVRKRLDQASDAIVTVSVPSLIGGQNIPVQMYIAGEDLAVLDALASRGKRLAEGHPGFQSPDTSVRDGKPELRVLPSRTRLNDMHMPAQQLGYAIRANLEGLVAGAFKRGDRSYDIRVKLAGETGRDQVSGFLFPGLPGQPVTMDTLGDVRELRMSTQINRHDKRRVSRVYADLSGFPLGNAVAFMDTAFKERVNVPPGYSWGFTGDYEMMSEGQRGLGDALLKSVILVILCLAAVMESWRHPWLIMTTVPLAFIGMIWGLYLGGESMGLFVIMGFVMMVGIVVNNAILIMDQFNVFVAKGESRHTAMIDAACDRFRPVAMITIAAVLGMAPLAFSRGIGAEIRNGVGLGCMGGILVSGVLTMLVLPVLYSLFTRRARKR